MPKHDLTLTSPLMNAAGSLGFFPHTHSPVDWSLLGAFITNPVSLQPRTPAHGRRFVEYPGGFLLHTGYPNPGFTRVVRQVARHWRHSPVPVILHLLARYPEEVEKMTRRLEQLEGVAGLEVGVDGDANADNVEALTQAASGELLVIIRLPLERAIELAPRAIRSGAMAISLAPPRGIYPAAGGELLQGRLYGPAIFPLALRAVQGLSQMGIATIGAGGVYTHEHMAAMLSAGAWAVQVDSAFWRGAGYHLLA
jgi:dihydroorotate dehydrogenase (NAD+) catalytic subunit